MMSLIILPRLSFVVRLYKLLFWVFSFQHDQLPVHGLCEEFKDTAAAIAVDFVESSQ